MALLASCQVLGGVSCVLAGLLRPPWVLPLSLAGKFCSSVVFLIVYLYTAEIYPTQLRGCGLALTATMARIGDFIAPYIAGGWALSAVKLSIGSTSGCTITEKTPTRAFSWLKAPTSAFTFKTLLRHYAKQALIHSS